MITTTNTGTPYQYTGTNHDAQGTPVQKRVDSPPPAEEDDSPSLTPAQRYASQHRRSTSLHSTTSSRPDVHTESLERDPSDLDAARNMFPPEIPLFTHQSRRAAPAFGGDDNRVSDVSQNETCDSHTPLQPLSEVTHDAPPGKDYGMRTAAGATVPVDGNETAVHPGEGVPKPVAQEWLYERPLPPHYPGLAYCKYCKIYKPDRTHHCRHCGQCILAME